MLGRHCQNHLLVFGLILAGCSNNGSQAGDAGQTPDGDAVGVCTPADGTARVPSVVAGRFSNGVLSGVFHPWLEHTTSASSITFGCQGDAPCAAGAEFCAHVVIEGSPTFNLVPSYLEPSSSVPQAGFGLTLDQGPDRGSTPAAWCPRGDGLYVAFTEGIDQIFVVELTTEDPLLPGATERWCSSPGTAAPDLTVPWTQFWKCNASSPQFYSPTHPIRAIDIYVEPRGTTPRTLDLCLLDVVPYGLPSEVISCTDWERFPIPGTQNVLINNVWNKNLARGRPNKQCLTKRHTDAGDQFGWTWDWPDIEDSSSYAAPEVVWGRKPWDGGDSTTPDLPRRIDALQSLSLDYAVEIMAGQSYNLNATMWLTQTEAAPSTPDPQNVVAEVMVRFNNPLGIAGGDVDDGQVTLGGIPFRVTHQDAHADASGGSSTTWKMVVYDATSSRLAGQFDLALVLRDMLAKGLAQPENGVQGVEFITEVSGGRGEVWLNRFGVTAR